MSYRCVVEDDVAARHVAVENVLLQVLNERPLQRTGGRGRYIFRLVLHTSIHFAPNQMLKDAMDKKNAIQRNTQIIFLLPKILPDLFDYYSTVVVFNSPVSFLLAQTSFFCICM